MTSEAVDGDALGDDGSSLLLGEMENESTTEVRRGSLNSVRREEAAGLAGSKDGPSSQALEALVFHQPRDNPCPPQSSWCRW